MIISPWNYPINLNFVPLVDALAAGNTAILKPSSRAKSTQNLIEKICSEAFDKSLVEVVKVDRTKSDGLINEDIDKIFFTGSSETGAKIMEKASHYFIPVTLELGGKSPVIVDDTCNIKDAARRIVFGKLLNSGQTCIAPDFLYVKENIKDLLIYEMIKNIEISLPNEKYINLNYPKIIDRRQFDSIIRLLENQNLLIPKKFGKKFMLKETEQILPVFVDDPDFDSIIMKKEIFGPIFPVKTWKSKEELIENSIFIKKPLALYVFSKDKNFVNYVLENIQSGGATINSTILHITGNNAPFGGIGNSGIGNYHGKFGFETFSYERTILEKNTTPDYPFIYHPYTNAGEKLILKLI